MNKIILMLMVSISSWAGAVYAEEASESDNIQAYCNEQAELSGIEDGAEKRQFIEDCKASFDTSGGEAPQE
jgi:hypothetical protein